MVVMRPCGGKADLHPSRPAEGTPPPRVCPRDSGSTGWARVATRGPSAPNPRSLAGGGATGHPDSACAFC